MKNYYNTKIKYDHCIYCDCYLQHRISAQHQRTLKHIINYEFFNKLFIKLTGRPINKNFL